MNKMRNLILDIIVHVKTALALGHIYNLFLTKVISAEEFTDLVKRVYQNVRNHYYGN